MEVDDVVDLSMATTPSSGISQATVRDLQALTQTSGLTITRALPPPSPLSLPTPMNSSTQESSPTATGDGAGITTGNTSAAVPISAVSISDNGATTNVLTMPNQDNGELREFKSRRLLF